MNCMKCGKEAQENQAFCPDCLKEMEKYPVRPGTVVQLPRHDPVPHPKKSPVRRPRLSAEDQIRQLKNWVRVLACGLILCIGLLVGMGYLLTQKEAGNDIKLPGQNYSAQPPVPTIPPFTTTEPD